MVATAQGATGPREQRILDGRVKLRLRTATRSDKLVRRLEDGIRSAGPHAVTWNGTDDRGRAVPAGVYFVRLSANGVAASRRVTLVR